MDKDLARELQRLQAQVAALSAQVAEQTPTADASTSADTSDSPLLDALHKAGETLPEWKQELDEIVQSLKGEVEKHPVTGVAVAFALGLIVGQLLRR